MLQNKVRRIILTLMVALITALTAACWSRAEREHVEIELAVFMRDYLVEEFLDVHGENSAFEVPGIIIWAPPGRKPHSPSEFVKLDQPIRVWLYAHSKLSEQSDRITAIEAYQQMYMQYPGSDSWAFYTIGIESIARGWQQAEVYVGAFCGPLCGLGARYTLQRSADGGWEITGSERVWIM